MVRALETINGDGGSIKVGTTGTISALISRELESTKLASQMPPFGKDKSSADSVLVPSDATNPKRPNPRTSMHEASSSGTSNCRNHRSPKFFRKTRHYYRKSRHIPMLNTDNNSLDGTPSREKPDKKGSCIVEVVDVKCGNPERTWVSPLTKRLKKLSFSKLSESIV